MLFRIEDLGGTYAVWYRHSRQDQWETTRQYFKDFTKAVEYVDRVKKLTFDI